MRRFVVCVGYIVILMLFASCGRINEPARRGEGTLLTRADETPEITTEETPAPTPIPSPPAEPPVYIPYEPAPTPPPLDEEPITVFPNPLPPHATPAHLQVWNITPRTGFIPPSGNHTAAFLRPFSAHYRGAEHMQVYLTFELSQEMGYTAQLLDVLHAFNTQAAFFLTLPYIENNDDTVLRMISEGHVVALRSHQFLPELDSDSIGDELLAAIRHFSENFGRPIDPFLRPAGGAYSEASLTASQHYGFFTVFWSALHYDWLQGDTYAHMGMVLSLPNINAVNIEALPDLLTRLQSAGFTFATLYALI